MLPIFFILLYTTGFVVSTSNYGLTDLSSFHHTSSGSDHGGELKMDSESLASHTYIRRQGIETQLPSANLEPETSGAEVLHTHTHTHTHTLSLSVSLSLSLSLSLCLSVCLSVCTAGTGEEQFIY